MSNLTEKIITIQKELKAPKVIKEGYRKFHIINCSKCDKEMKVSSDYIEKHSGMCMSCQKRNNTNAKKHGDYNTRLYKIWLGLGHRRYRGYTPEICDEWKDYIPFKKWSLNNGYEDNLTIDRIDNNGGYYPGNCQWITLEENSGKDKKIFSEKEEIEIYKERLHLGITQVEMAKKLGVSRNTIQRAERRAKQCQS